MVKQKAKKAEKSKVKLKTSLKNKTKFLPKGGNVTNTNFKIKPIVIQEQLKAKNSAEPLSSRKLTFKELFTRLNHHNTNVRYDGCNGLLELLNASSQEVVEMQLHSLLLGAAKLFVDKEAKVRRHAVKLVTELLAKVSNIKLTPFFDILISYTACAMTHLDINIQEDSLLIIDAYLNHIPVLIAKHHLRLFPNFLTLISKLRAESTSRVLITDLRSSATTIKWRIKVLYRLRGILRAITKDKAPKKVHVKTILAKDARYIPIYKGVRKCSLDFLRSNEKTGGNNLTEHVDVLLPLLYCTWAEAIEARNKFDDENTMIDYDVAATLSCSLGIFHLLWDYAIKTDKNQRQRFVTKANQAFFNHVLMFFPYQQKHACSSEISLDVNIEPKLVNENLLVCFMFCTLWKDLARNGMFRAKSDTVVHYLTTCLVNRNYVKTPDVFILLSSLRLIFFDYYSVWSQRQFDFEDLLSSVIHFYRYNQLGDDVNVELFKLLSDMMQVPELKSFDVYKKWLSEVPVLLCRPRISLEVLNCISWLSRQDDLGLKESIRTNLRAIIDNIGRIEVVSSDFYPSSLKICHIINVLDCFSQFDLNYMQRFMKGCSDDDLKLCLTNIIKQKRAVNCCSFCT